MQYDLAVHCYEPLVGVDRHNEGFTLTTRHGAAGAAGQTRQYRCNRIVLATGGTDRPRKLSIPGEDLPHVSHYFKDPHTYFRQNLLVVGGKNSAVESALRCYQAGAQVSISYRRRELPAKSIKYWLMPEIGGLLHAKRIGGHFCTVPTEITPTHVTLSPVDDQFVPTGEPYQVPADFVLLLTGYEQDNSLLKLVGVELVDLEQRPNYDETTMETNVPGVYVAGTATGGTQERYSIFLENCHVHVERIVASIQGQTRQIAEPTYASPES
jgi:thioredoxin reductase (NADPH)